MTAPSSVYVYMSPLQQILWDKDLNVPLAAGVVKFYSDPGFTTPKDVYAQNQTAPYAFVSVGSTLTLSGIGTFVNPNDGTNFIPFMFPFVGSPASYDPLNPPASESYFIEAFNSDNVSQFTISDWPPNSASSIATSSGFNFINVQQFTSHGSSTYTPHAGMQWCVVKVLGAGGGGGGCAAAGAATVTLGGAGGSGAYSEGVFDAATIAGSQLVTVGAGGVGGSAGANAGTAGTASSLGAILTAPGGAAGVASTAAAQASSKLGGAGGAAGSGGYLNSPGMKGGIGFGLYTDSPGAAYALVTGMPGSTAYGSGTQTTTGAASAGTGNGAGGGAGSAANTGAAAGAAGLDGFVIITEYCTV